MSSFGTESTTKKRKKPDHEGGDGDSEPRWFIGRGVRIAFRGYGGGRA